MQFKEDKLLFHKLMVAHGAENLDQLLSFARAEMIPIRDRVGRKRLLRWEERFFRGNALRQGRYVNRFQIGADPEFVLESEGREGGMRRVDATAVGLRTGTAFGADLNGRLVEVRPAPSRSTLSVTASLLDTLRWMAIMSPTAMEYTWTAGAYRHRDGLGGHVHFGRKAATREREVRALDGLFTLGIDSGLFNGTECHYRQRETPYGRPGDVRFQAHGFEYRTLPSWIGSPWEALFVLTIAKLLVYMPTAWQLEGDGGGNLQTRARNLLAYFKGRDDDAALVYEVLQRKGLPTPGTRLKQSWGLSVLSNTGQKLPAFIPNRIEPNVQTVLELERHLLEGAPLAMRRPEGDWQLPKNYIGVIDYTVTARQLGMGELLWDAVCHSQCPLQFHPSDRNADLLNLPGWLRERVAEEAKELGNLVRFRGATLGETDRNIYIGAHWRTGDRLLALRKALFAGWLPVWRQSEVKADSWERWQAAFPARSVTPEPRILSRRVEE